MVGLFFNGILGYTLVKNIDISLTAH